MRMRIKELITTIETVVTVGKTRLVLLGFIIAVIILINFFACSFIEAGWNRLKETYLFQLRVYFVIYFSHLLLLLFH